MAAEIARILGGPSTASTDGGIGFDSRTTAPLSENAARLWRAHLAGDGAEYSVPLALDVSAPVDADRVVAAVLAVIEANPVLRSTITESEGRFHYAPSDGVSAEVVDVRPDELDERTDEVVRTPFRRLDPGPLTRVVVLRTSGEVTRIVLVFHHVVIDGESVTLLLSDVMADYAEPGSAAARRRPQFPDLAPDILGPEATRRAEQFWAGQRDAGAGAEVWNRAAPTASGTAVVDRGPVGSSGCARDAAARLGVGEGTVWCAATVLALSRIVGARSLTVRLPAANRHELEEFDAIGPFVTTAPLTVRIDEASTLARLTVELDRAVSGVLEHSRLAPVSGVTGDADILLNIQNSGSDRDRLRGDGLAVVPVHSGDAKAALTVSLQIGAGAADCQLESALVGWDADTHEGFRTSVGRVLDALAARPETLIGSLEIGEFGSLRTGVAGLRPGSEPTSTHRSHLLDAIADRAAEDPDAEAVIAGAWRLTRSELWAEVVECSARLRATGVIRGDRVLIPTVRTAEFVVWAAAVMNVGAAYVPVDPVGGASRIPHIVASGGARFGIALGDWSPETGLGLTTVGIESAADAVDPGAGEVAGDTTRMGEDIAYVIYTSGTTGAPKGVAVPHSAVMALVDSQGDHLREGDTTSCLHAFTFDFSVWEVWCALAVGARVCVYDEETVRDPFELLGALADDSVTVLSLTNTALGSLLAAVDASAGSATGGGVPGSVRRVVLGGESVSGDFVVRWSAHAGPGCEVVNMLGATETTVHTTQWRMGYSAELLDRVPVGRPLGHLDTVVVDPGGHALPAGVDGEIAVRGHGVAYGYLGRPGTTARSFVPDPFPGAVPGGRLYLTGDRGRWATVDGDPVLFCHGRADGQLKVRGHRIEAAGVEAVLSRCPDVLHAGVIAHSGSLVGFVQLAAGSGDIGEALRRVLACAAEGLAQYEVPDVLHAVLDLPTTVNGKLDRDPEALLGRVVETGPAPGDGEAGSAAARHTTTRPVAETRTVVVDTMATVLGTDRLDWNRGFTANGGDSIKAVKLAGALRRSGFDVSVRDILQAGSLGELAEREPDSPEAFVDVPIPQFGLVGREVRDQLPPDAEDAYPLSAGQEGMLFRVLLDGDVGVYHNTVSIRIRGVLDPRAFRVALADTMRRHEVLRTAIDQETDLEPLQVVYREVPPPFEFIDASGPDDDPDALLADLVERERRSPFDLDVAPLFRFVLVRVGDGVNQLIVSDNHVILDGWSWTSTLAELIDRHNALVRRDGSYDSGFDSSVPTKFVDYVAAERATRDDADAVAAWRGHLRGVTVRSIADRRSGGAREVYRIKIDISGEMHELLQAGARAVGVSPRHLMMAVHFRALAEEFDTHDLVSGLTSNGRLERVGGDEVRGMFLNMLPLRVETGGDLGRLARRCAHTEAGMSPWRRLPLVDIQHTTGSGPLFDYGFNFVQFHRLGRIEDSHDFGTTGDPHYSREDTEFALMATFSVHPPENRLALILVVDADRVSATRAERLTNRYRSALASATEFAAGERAPDDQVSNTPEMEK